MRTGASNDWRSIHMPPSVGLSVLNLSLLHLSAG